MPAVSWYRQNPLLAYGSGSAGNAPNMDWLSDDIRHALVQAAYTPDLDAHDFFNDVVANEASGTGYTAGGFALASKTLVATPANSLATAWAAATAYGSESTSLFVRPTVGNGYIYMATNTGTSHATTEPTWPTVIGQTVNDNGIIWTCFARNLIVFDAADLLHTGLSVSFRYSVFYNRTPATDATRPLLALYDWGATQTITGGSVSFPFHSQGFLAIGVG